MTHKIFLVKLSHTDAQPQQLCTVSVGMIYNLSPFDPSLSLKQSRCRERSVWLPLRTASARPRVVRSGRAYGRTSVLEPHGLEPHGLEPGGLDPGGIEPRTNILLIRSRPTGISFRRTMPCQFLYTENLHVGLLCVLLRHSANNKPREL